MHSVSSVAVRVAMCVAFVGLDSPHRAIVFAQDDADGAEAVEHWLGALEIGAIKLRLRIDVTTNDDGSLNGTMVSLDQGGAKIPMDSISISADEMTFKIDRIQAQFAGKVNEQRDAVTGKFSQFGHDFELTLNRITDLESTLPHRPQMPRKPFPYEIREVKFNSAQAGDVVLAGTLTVPQDAANGSLPAVVLVTGSGPQDRDESLLGHKPFWVIADYLTRNGVVVLRFDDRGFGESTGIFSTATTADFAADARAAIQFLRGVEVVDPNRIGLIGHSEGGIVAAMLAASDTPLAHVIMLAGTGVPGDEVILSQARAITERSGVVDSEHGLRIAVMKKVKQGASADDVKQFVESYLEDQERENSTEATATESESQGKDDARQEFLKTAFAQMASPWFRFFLTHDPRADLRRARCPVFALIGVNDLQVLVDINMPEIEKALAESGTAGHRCERIDGVNHLFQHTSTGLPTEYGEIEETFAPHVLEKLLDWIRNR